MTHNPQDTLFAIDLSTSCTGYARFSMHDKSLLEHGHIKPSVSGLAKMQYPLKQLSTMRDMATKVTDLILSAPLPKTIVIEEIAGSKSRMTQKVLDGMHWILADAFEKVQIIDRVWYYDVTGCDGWRTHLGLRLTDADKKNNAEAKKLNKKLGRGTTKLPIVGPKHLSARFANHEYGLTLDVDANTFDADRADAICLGHAFLRHADKL